MKQQSKNSPAKRFLAEQWYCEYGSGDKNCDYYETDCLEDAREWHAHMLQYNRNGLISSKVYDRQLNTEQTL